MQVNPIHQIKRHLSARAALRRVPLNGAFELTPRCNFRCKMCYVRMTPEQMAPIGRERTAAEWLALGRQARDAGLVFLLLTGGEPFLRPDFAEIYTGLTEMGLSISINTNGSLLNDSLRTLFRRLPPATVNVTVYGASPEGYERLCGSGTGFSQALECIDFFRGIGVTVNMNTTITPWNLDQYEGIWELARSRGMKPRVTGYNFPPTRRSHWDGYDRLSAEAVGELLARDTRNMGGPEYLLDAAARLGTGDEIPMSCSLEPGDPMACHAGKSQFWITWDGRMTPCGMLNSPAVQPFERDFTDCWKDLVARSDSISLCPDCKDCAIRGTCTNCAAVTAAETGSFHGRPEYMCRLNRSYRLAIRRMAEELK